ncbi:hypothetical protein Tco_0117733 [Tanacetum coccineum]
MFNSDTLPGETSDEIHMKEEEVVFKIHTKGYFEYDPLRYVNGSVSCVSAFTHDKDVFTRCLNHIMSEIDEHKWALFYHIQKKSLDKGLNLLHTDNDVHSFFDVVVKNGSIHLYVAHKKQNLAKYYYKNIEWEEDDAGLRCCSSTPFDTSFKRKISKSKKTSVIHDEGADKKRMKTLVNGGSKGKEKVFEDEGADKKRMKTLVNGGSKGKEKVFEDECAVKTGRDRCVVIGGKEEVASKRGVGSRKMHETSVKGRRLTWLFYCIQI